MGDVVEQPVEQPELALPDSPVGRQVAWFLQHSLTRGRDLTVEEVEAHMSFPGDWTPANGLARFHTADDRPYRITKIVIASPTSLDATFDYGDGKPWDTSVTVEDEPPHRIIRMFWSRAIPDDIVIRPATGADGAALNDLEVRAPMQLGATTVVYDRGEDFLGFGRLMGDNICFVAERERKLLGLACGASHPVRIGGVEYRVMLLHHLRVPLEHRKGGIFSALNAHVFGAFDSRFGAYGYTALDNAEGMRIGGPGTWSITVFRALLDCAALAGPAHGRTATPADAESIIDVLNRSHDREEMYLPSTRESFVERMERAADLYTWHHVLMGDGAVLGVWPAGVTVTTSRDGETRRTRRAVVLDHGYVEGALDEFERLLRAWCGRLVELGHSELTLITSEGSPNYPFVREVAHHIDPFSFRMSVPEPEGTKQRGLYVDAIYF